MLFSQYEYLVRVKNRLILGAVFIRMLLLIYSAESSTVSSPVGAAAFGSAGISGAAAGSTGASAIGIATGSDAPFSSIGAS
jgi:hypothetical protein